MEFEKGNTSKPTGNLVLYTEVEGENPVRSGAKVIASNIFVSLLGDGENMPAVTFAPVAYDSMNEFNKSLSRFTFYDLVKLPLFKLPENPVEAGSYINSRLEQVNEMVRNYIDLILKQNQKNEISHIQSDRLLDNISDRLDVLENLTKTVRESIKSKNPVEEELNNLSKLTDEFINKNPEYPLKHLSQYASLDDDRADTLIELFFKLCRAIQLENYEAAGIIQAKIGSLTPQLPF